MGEVANRARLSIDVPPEARRRIRTAAAKRDQSIRDYVWEAVEARLKEDAPDPFGDALTAQTDPVLADLWDNPKDAVYDTLEPRRAIIAMAARGALTLPTRPTLTRFTPERARKSGAAAVTNDRDERG